jgi:hypothetical protein
MPDDELTGTVQRWAAEPWAFVRECFGVTPDAWQDHALHLVAKPETRRLALKACKGPGKTALLAWVILWFLSTRYQAKVGCTSITEGNIDSNLWPELAKWMGRSSFLSSAFIWTRTTVARRASPENWFAVKRTWPKSGDAQQQADALAGLHADHIMFVLDESGGIPQAVMVTAEAVLSTAGSEAKVIQAGNPTHTTGPLYRACTTDRHLWQVIQITGDPDDPLRSPRIALDWAREQIASYGRDNPWVQVNVLGAFPAASINALLGVEEVEAAMKRHLRTDQFDWAQKRLGVDVARFGDDRTVIFPRQGLASFRPIVMRNARTTDIAAKVMLCKRRWGSELEIIDDTGHWGHGVIDNLLAAGIPVLGINYAGKALNPRYRNRRAEMWIQGAEAIRHGAALPPIPEMVAELTEPTYTFLNGVFVLEEKDQVKERLQRSPDLADAYMQTYAFPDMPGDVMERLKRTTATSHDFDPYGAPAALGEARVAVEFDPFAWRQ